MKTHHYVAIAIRLFAIYIVISELKLLPMLSETIRTGDSDTSIFLGLLAFVTIAIAIILWIFPISLARKFLNPNLDKEINSLNTLSIVSLIIISIGLYILASSAGNVMYLISLVYQSNQTDVFGDISIPLSTELKASIFATSTDVLVGFTFVIFGKSISKWLYNYVK